MRSGYILLIVGTLVTVAGVSYLAAVYAEFMSDAGKLLSLLLTAGLFAFLGAFLREIRW